MVIGINGKIGSGKDTIGKIIQYLQCYNTGQITLDDVINNPEHQWWLEEQSKFEIKKFARKLKEIASLLTGIDVEMFEDQEFKKQEMPECWNKLQQSGRSKVSMPMTYREFLQKLGTEAMRDGLHTNVWVNALFADYKIFNEPSMYPNGGGGKEPNWIITDMRFPNEMEAIVERKGITIRVVRLFQTDIIDGNKVSWIPIPGVDYIPHASETALDNAEFDYEIINDGTLEELVEKVREILVKEKII